MPGPNFCLCSENNHVWSVLWFLFSHFGKVGKVSVSDWFVKIFDLNKNRFWAPKRKHVKKLNTCRVMSLFIWPKLHCFREHWQDADQVMRCVLGYQSWSVLGWINFHWTSLHWIWTENRTYWAIEEHSALIITFFLVAHSAEVIICTNKHIAYNLKPGALSVLKPVQKQTLHILRTGFSGTELYTIHSFKLNASFWSNLKFCENATEKETRREDKINVRKNWRKNCSGLSFWCLVPLRCSSSVKLVTSRGCFIPVAMRLLSTVTCNEISQLLVKCFQVLRCPVLPQGLASRRVWGRTKKVTWWHG